MITRIHFIYGLEVFDIIKDRFDTEVHLDYARYYSHLAPQMQTTWWFSKIDYSLFSQQDLIRNYGYTSSEQIHESENYLPFARVDILSLELNYLEQYFPNEIKVVSRDNLDASFKCLLDKNNSTSHWYSYEREALRKTVVQWCKKNHIAYI